MWCQAKICARRLLCAGRSANATCRGSPEWLKWTCHHCNCNHTAPFLSPKTGGGMTSHSFCSCDLDIQTWPEDSNDIPTFPTWTLLAHDFKKLEHHIFLRTDRETDATISITTDAYGMQSVNMYITKLVRLYRANPCTNCSDRTEANAEPAYKRAGLEPSRNTAISRTDAETLQFPNNDDSNQNDQPRLHTVGWGYASAAQTTDGRP